MIRSILNFIFFKRNRTNNEESLVEEDSLEFVWSLTGNIVNEHTYGENKEIRRGTKHFSPGTKVYCIPEYGGMGHERITVIGIPRRSRRYIKVVIPFVLIENWQIKKVYHPHVKKLLLANWKWTNSKASKNEVISFVDSINKYARD